MKITCERQEIEIQTREVFFLKNLGVEGNEDLGNLCLQLDEHVRAYKAYLRTNQRALACMYSNAVDEDFQLI